MVTIGEEQEQCLLGVHLQNISRSQSTEAETVPQTLMHFSHDIFIDNSQY